MHELSFQGIETIHANLAEKDDKILDLEGAIKTKEYENEVCKARTANRIFGKGDREACKSRNLKCLHLAICS